MKPFLFLPLLLAGCGADMATEPVRDARAQTRATELLAGKVAGRTQACISMREADRQSVIDESTILYRVSSTKVYRNDLSRPCPNLDRNSTLIRRSTQSNICSGEIFEVRDSGTGFSYGACTFGDFTEFRTPER